MAFPQMDGSIRDRVSATCLPQPVNLKDGAHIETIHFIVIPGMT